MVLRSVGSNDDHNDHDHDDGSRDNNDSGIDHNYNGGRKGYYNPAVNYDYLYNSGSTASPATAASAANNDRACDNCCGDHDNCC